MHWRSTSLGIGANEVAMQPTGPFAELILWINVQQRNFYLAMTHALKAMREDPWQASILVGLSFLYGILHAVGPGHGKAVISSYMLANETTLRRGVLLSFASSMLQAFTAIFVIGLTFLVLRGTTVSMDDAAHYMEMASFVLIIAFGLSLLWRKVPLLFRPQVAHLVPEKHGVTITITIMTTITITTIRTAPTAIMTTTTTITITRRVKSAPRVATRMRRTRRCLPVTSTGRPLGPQSSRWACALALAHLSS